ncbi:MAG: cysteine--tRNA ligase [Hyphomonadaceae bacterium]
MPLRLYNTLAREKQDFAPADPKRVTLYVCGPTVYNHAHIGNFRPVIVFDTLFRLLRATYGEAHVLYARNITDIEDKIIATALADGITINALTRKYADIYNAESRAINALPPTIEPWATAHISEMLDIITALIEKGNAYVAQSGVWFHVPSMADYGKLSGRKPEDNEAGARVEVSDEKRDPADFALWKFAKPDEPEDAIWDSPWGKGRPGWHIECSAMAAAQLGTTIDIHGGGVDLQFPHHENEIAQSQCAHGAPMATYWMHNGFLDMSGEKMSKSLGNVVLLKDLLEDWDGEVIRFAMLSGHYRMPLDWTPDLLAQAKTTLDRIYGALGRVWNANDTRTTDQTVLEALKDDLNTPLALSALSALSGAANMAADAGDQAGMAQAKADLLAAGEVLGILQVSPADWAKGTDGDDNARIDALVTARNDARAAKDWAESDRIRDELKAEGIEIMDGADGASWRRV